MNAIAPIDRDLIFISKATPGDDQFVLWLAPCLEAAGYKVFADIFDLDAGDEWRGKLTAALQTRAIKMLLCCSDESLARRGVREEISIAEDLTKQLQDPNFIVPLKIRTFQKLFGIGGLQYVLFEGGWAKGLASLLKSLERQQVPKAGGGIIQPEWYAYLRRRAVEIEAAPEVLTSNWLRVVGMPEKLNHLVPRNRAESALLRKLGASFEFPMAEFGDGFLTFANPLDLTEHFERVRPPPGRRESISVIPNVSTDFTRRPLPSIFSICARNDSMAGSGRKFLVDLWERVQHHVLYSFYISRERVKSDSERRSGIGKAHFGQEPGWAF